MGLEMIRLITFRNFPLVDLQIERAYRRRCGDEEKDYAFVETIDDELLWMVRQARLRRRQDSDWLRELARQIDTLSSKGRKRSGSGRRRAAATVMAANAAP
jgi:hypothetical protein